MIFLHPYWFFALLFIPILWIGTLKKSLKPSIIYSHICAFDEISGSSALIWDFLPRILRCVCFSLFIIALARPQKVSGERIVEAETVDIILTLDISGSMLAMDFQPKNRVQVAKEEAIRFIRKRPHDRLGLVVFAGESFTQCPLTTDGDILIKLFEQIDVGMIQDGTAIGMAIATAINRLRNSTSKSKIIVLITDGANNAGNIDPKSAAELAWRFGIRIYTIGVGKEGLVPFPVEDPLFGKRYVQAKVDMDEPSLMEIAEITGGKYFRAEDERSMEEIYDQIDQLEKTKIEIKEFSVSDEYFHYFLLPGLLLMFTLSLVGSILDPELP